MTVLAALPEHQNHLGHLLIGSAFVVVSLLLVAALDHEKSRVAEGHRRVRGMLLPSLAVASAAAATIHFSVTPEHWSEDPTYGVLFLLAASAQLICAALLLIRPQRLVLTAAVAGNLVILLAWLQTRTLGIPFGGQAGVRESLGVLDVLASSLEAFIVLGGATALRSQAPGAHVVQQHVLRGRHQLVVDAPAGGRRPGP